MTYTMRTATGRANVDTRKPKQGGYRYSGPGRKPDGTRPDPQAELRQVASEIKHVAAERGHQPASNAVPAPAPIFAENKPATKMNSKGHMEPGEIWPQEPSRTHVNRDGFLDPGSIFDQPAGAHEPHTNAAGVPEPRSIFDDTDNR